MSNKYSLSLGRIAGIKLFVHWTFFILIAWTVYSDVKAGLGTVEILWSVGYVLAIFVCVTLHELGHSLAARRYHIGTKEITLLPIGGVASLEAIPQKPKEELVIAFAGPAVNILIIVALLPFILFTTTLADLANLKIVGQNNFLIMLLAVNVSLAVFNLIPAFPMDGGRVFRALLAFKMDRAKATQIAALVGQLIAAGFVVLGFYGNPFLIFIGVFIFFGAQSEARYTKAQSLLSGYTIADVTIRQFPTLASTLPIRDVAQHLLAGQNKSFLVVDHGEPVGSIGRNEIIKALNDMDDTTPVKDAMDKELLVLDSRISLEQGWRDMQLKKKSVALVYERGALLGALEIDNIAEFILIRNAQNKS